MGSKQHNLMFMEDFNTSIDFGYSNFMKWQDN